MDFSKKNINIYSIVVCAASLLLMLPIIYLARYNHSSADDYTYAILTHRAWLDTHSAWNVIAAAIQTSKDSYNSWQGTYTSCFLFALQPGIWGDRYYAATTLLMMFSIWGGNCLFCLYILPRFIGVRNEKLAYVSITALISSYMISFMPSPVQGLYWYNGSAHYTLFYLPLMVLFSVYYGVNYDDEKKVKSIVFKTIMGVLAGMFVSGGNFVSALLSIIIGVLALAYSIWTKRKEKIIPTALVLLFALVGFLLSVTAPGNEVRKTIEGTGSISPVMAILRSIEEGILHVNRWIGFHTIIFIILLAPIVIYLFSRKSKEGVLWKKKYPVWVSIVSIGLLFSMFTPSIYALNMAGSDRVLNLIWYVAVLVVVFNFIYYFGWLTDRWMNGNLAINMRVRKSSAIVAMATICVFAIIGLELSTSAKAVRSIFSGEAMRWHVVNNEREAMYANYHDEDIVVGPYEVKPELLFFSDLSEDKNVWPNTSLAEYYGIKSVELFHE